MKCVRYCCLPLMFFVLAGCADGPISRDFTYVSHPILLEGPEVSGDPISGAADISMYSAPRFNGGNLQVAQTYTLLSKYQSIDREPALYSLAGTLGVAENVDIKLRFTNEGSGLTSNASGSLNLGMKLQLWGKPESAQAVGNKWAIGFSHFNPVPSTHNETLTKNKDSTVSADLSTKTGVMHLYTVFGSRLDTNTLIYTNLFYIDSIYRTDLVTDVESTRIDISSTQKGMLMGVRYTFTEKHQYIALEAGATRTRLKHHGLGEDQFIMGLKVGKAWY
ncbi:MAG: hypothetical protein OEZ47_01150 [Gammaproteobacteria bacterium]|nr:hypothetical protein [Gammaproteobacteria bacterium]